MHQANLQRDKDEREKFEKQVKRKKCEEINAQLLEATRNSRMNRK